MKIYLNDIGGLGNRMFFYSFYLSMKKKMECEFIVFPERKNSLEKDDLYRMTADDPFFKNRTDFEDPYIKNKNLFEKIVFFISKRTVHRGLSYYELEKALQPFLNDHGSVRVTDGYIPFEIKKDKGKIFCTGYFQSEKYFENVKEEVKQVFYHPELIQEGNEELLKRIQNGNSVCLHVRLGDYVENETARKKHYVCTPDYYKKAIDQAKKEIKDPAFFVFTNNVQEARKIFSDHPELIYSENDNDAISDMQLMMQCRHFIISNSTFSWWAQYLSRNKGKTVFAPSRWFNDGTVTDLYNKDWKLIEV